MLKNHVSLPAPVGWASLGYNYFSPRLENCWAQSIWHSLLFGICPWSGLRKVLYVSLLPLPSPSRGQPWPLPQSPSLSNRHFLGHYQRGTLRTGGRPVDPGYLGCPGAQRNCFAQLERSPLSVPSCWWEGKMPVWLPGHKGNRG